MTDKEIFDSIIEFYNDENFIKLKQFYERTTVFDIMKSQRWEVRHSSFLAWLLDVRGSHGLSDEPLKRFLRLAASKGDPTKIASKLRNNLIVGNYTIENFLIKTEKSVSGEKGGRIDVYISFKTKDEKDVSVIIENKMYTGEHSNQLKRYWNAIKEETKGASKIVGVFLLPPSNQIKESEIDSRYARITYQDLMEFVLEPLQGLEMTNETAMLLRDYIVNLGKPSLEVDENGEVKKGALSGILATTREASELVGNIYTKHSKLLVETLRGEDKLLNDFLDNNLMYLQLIFNNLELLDIQENYEEIETLVKQTLKFSSKKRKTYLLDGQEVKGNNCLILAIVKHYVEQNEDATIEGLKTLFNWRKLRHNGQVITLKDEAKKDEININNYGCNYFLDNSIKLKDNNEIVVWRYWPDDYFLPFIDMVKKELGYKIVEKI